MFKRWRDWGLRNLAKSTGSHFEPSCYPFQIHLAPNLWTALFKGRNVYQVNFHFSWKRNPPLSQMTRRPLQTWSRLFIERNNHKSATQRNAKLGQEVGKGFLTVALPQLWDRDQMSLADPQLQDVTAGPGIRWGLGEAGVEQEGGALPRVRSAPGTENNGHSHHSCLVPLLCDSWNLADLKNVTPRSKEGVGRIKKPLPP